MMTNASKERQEQVGFDPYLEEISSI